MKPKHVKKSLSIMQELRRIAAIIWDELTRKKTWFDKYEEENGL